MAAESDEILHDFHPMLRQYKDGRVERFAGTEVVPASVDPETGVKSKDVDIAPEFNVWARLFLPKDADRSKKLPLLVYFHGGGFMVESAATPLFHKHLNLLAAEANVVAVSVTYRLAPEHPLPAAYEDCWLAVRWVASQSMNEEWIRDYADLDRVYFGGDSAGGNIAHHMGLRVGVERLEGINLRGVFLNCPSFWGEDPIGNERLESKALKREWKRKLWYFLGPTISGLDHHWINPGMDQNLSKFGSKRILVFCAEHDVNRDRNLHYPQQLKESGWDGEVEVVDVEGEDHDYSVFFPEKEKSKEFLKKVAAFINQN